MKSPSKSKPRTLTVRNIGDFYRKEVILQIRLQGKWLIEAGMQPETKVQVTNPRPGELVVKRLV
jgi:hypothetical protein